MKDALQLGVRVRDFYEIVRLLGSSELSRVYLARGPQGSTRYIVRELAPPVESPKQMERVVAHFMRAFEPVRQLKHTALPRISECFVWEEMAYTIREYVEEHTLHQVVQAQKGPAPDAQVRAWMGQLCDAFEFLHGQNPPFVFSGLKPESMVISPLGKVRILDYPWPSFLPRELQWKYARRTAPGYVSPEQAKGEAPTVASDVFNLGSLYYFMLTKADPSQYPYSKKRFPIQRMDGTEQMAALLDRALAEKPADRFASAAELKAALSDAGAPADAPAGELPFTLDSHQVVLENLRKGEVVRCKIHLASKTGTDIYGRLRTEQPWIRFKFDIFRGRQVELDFSIDTFDLAPGEKYEGLVLIDTEHGADEVDVLVSMSAPLGMRLGRLVKGLFSKG